MNNCPYTYEQMQEAGWSDEQLLSTPEYAHLVPVEIKVEDELVEYERLQDLMEALKESKDAIRDKVSQYMKNINSKETVITDSNGKQWKCVFQGRTNKRVDHKALVALLGDERYHQIVDATYSESLYIRPAPKNKKVKETVKSTPIQEPTQPNVPTGLLS